MLLLNAGQTWPWLLLWMRTTAMSAQSLTSPRSLRMRHPQSSAINIQTARDLTVRDLSDIQVPPRLKRRKSWPSSSCVVDTSHGA